ncbi:hypothetical protein, partial [Komagataeibacter kakiaceti]|uniref:hypothetical protein n=1 Tax=Komagataeibacter kakiaceti TaxID=943261 RepID=UPI0005507B9B
DARLLRRADLFWRSLQGLTRIICGSDVPDTMPAASLEILTGEFGVSDAASLLRLMDRMAARVTAVFDRLIPPITDTSAPATPQGSFPPPQSIA